MANIQNPIGAKSEGASSSGLVVGALAIGIAFAASVMLIVQHFGTALPGCGLESACHALSRSVWGSIPGIGWPTSFVGAAYFDAMLIAWILGKGRLPVLFRPILGLGVVASLVFVGVMIATQKFCPYCILAHVGHLIFASIAWKTASADTPKIAGIAAGASFVGLTICLAVLNYVFAEQRDSAAEAERGRSVAEILAAAGGDVSEDPSGLWNETGFQGRYLHGPESAPIRIVMFTDYQCPDCRRIEGELRKLMEGRTDLAVTIKHFPMCEEAGGGEVCNRHVNRTLHANACWAARAAEAAGILGGDEAFWQMHFWLFEKEGDYHPGQLRTQIKALGLDVAEFETVMKSDETLARVRADVDEGYALGLHYTPMIFVNGVELKGWSAPTAMARTVRDVAKASPPAKNMGDDRPVLAMSKYIEDWKSSRQKRTSEDSVPYIQGDADGEVEVVVYGDYQETNTVTVDTQVRAYLATHTGVRYNFRNYPVNTSCNRTLPSGVPASSLHPDACWAASVAEAAGFVGGEAAFFKAHIWLIENSESLSERDLESVSQAAGVSASEVSNAMSAAEVEDAILQDCRAGSATGLQSIPTVLVNGRAVPRLTREGHDVIEAILDAARAEVVK